MVVLIILKVFKHICKQKFRFGMKETRCLCMYMQQLSTVCGLLLIGILLVYLLVSIMYACVRIKYSRRELIGISSMHISCVFNHHDFPTQIMRGPGLLQWRRRKDKEAEARSQSQCEVTEPVYVLS